MCIFPALCRSRSRGTTTHGGIRGRCITSGCAVAAPVSGHGARMTNVVSRRSSRAPSPPRAVGSGCNNRYVHIAVRRVGRHPARNGLSRCARVARHRFCAVRRHRGRAFVPHGGRRRLCEGAISIRTQRCPSRNCIYQMIWSCGHGRAAASYFGQSIREWGNAPLGGLFASTAGSPRRPGRDIQYSQHGLGRSLPLGEQLLRQTAMRHAAPLQKTPFYILSPQGHI